MIYQKAFKIYIKFLNNSEKETNRNLEIKNSVA